jgi:hypothetical protein
MLLFKCDFVNYNIILRNCFVATPRVYIYISTNFIQQKDYKTLKERSGVPTINPNLKN